jgi:hypothetical protein
MEMENQCLEERSQFEKKVTRDRLRITHYHGRKVSVRRKEPIVREGKAYARRTEPASRRRKTNVRMRTHDE